MPGKHSREAVENKKLQEIIARRDKEIKDIKTECAEQFKMIKDLCFINEYNNKNIKLKKIYEIASDNFSALVKDIVINETDETAKIIELPNTDQSKQIVLKNTYINVSLNIVAYISKEIKRGVIWKYMN